MTRARKATFFFRDGETYFFCFPCTVFRGSLVFHGEMMSCVIRDSPPAPEPWPAALQRTASGLAGAHWTEGSRTEDERKGEARSR